MPGPIAGFFLKNETFDDIAPLLEREGIALSAAQVAALQRFVALLARWNRRINLTGARGRLYSRHLLDCLMLEKLPWPEGAREAIDIGSGAGLPGVTLALLHPGCRVTSVDSAAKKISFQQVVAAELDLRNFFPTRGDVARLAGMEEGRERFQLAVARAFAPLQGLLPVAAPLLAPGGVLWAMKGRRLAEEQAVLTPGALAAFEPEARLHRYDFPEAKLGGVVAVYRKKR